MSDKSANNLLVPTSPTITVPQTPQPLQTGGSATGNPRNKCALKPGHSLMDWIRLGSSGIDLSGTKGRTIPVTPEELAKHNRRDDAWMAIRGVVYNVTRYMDFHPGGVDELMRGVGRDATKLFNEIHAWVNYQQLLTKCRIGPLKSSVKLQSVIEENLTISLSEHTLAFPKPLVPPQDVIPRHNWVQNRNTVAISFYTKQFCNPGVVIQKLRPQNDDKTMVIFIIINLNLYKYEFQLHAQLNWPPIAAKIATEPGKIEITFSKTEEEKLWPELGRHEVKKFLKTSMEEELQWDFKVAHREQYNHDSFQMILKNETMVFILPLGYHLTIESLVYATQLSKCYTPVPKTYVKNKSNELSWQNDVQALSFLIKQYNHQKSFSSHLASIPVDSVVKVSIPTGNFKLSSLVGHRCLCLLAAGSGITPILSLIEHLLQRNTNRIELLKLYYFNKTSEDIWCRDILANMAQKDERFELINILSNPDDSWNGANGHVSLEMLHSIVDRTSQSKCTFVGVCGPTGFNEKIENILQKLEFPKEAMFIF